MLERARVFIRADSAGICLHPTGEDLLRRSVGKRSPPRSSLRAALYDPLRNPVRVRAGDDATNLTLDHLRVPSLLCSFPFPNFPLQFESKKCSISRFLVGARAASRFEDIFVQSGALSRERNRAKVFGSTIISLSLSLSPSGESSSSKEVTSG